jgi:hypothetical protein
MTDRLDPKAVRVPTATPPPEVEPAQSGDADRLVGALLVGLLGGFAAGAGAWAGFWGIAMIIGAAILGYLAVAALAWFLWARQRFVKVGYGVTILLVNGVMIGVLLVFKPVDALTVVGLLASAAFSLWIGVWWIRRGMRAGGGLVEPGAAADQPRN